MRRWLAAAGGLAVAAGIVVACAQHTPETPSAVGSATDGDGKVRVLDESPGPVFPSMGPVPTNPSTAPVPTNPSTAPVPTNPSTAPVPTNPSTAPVPTSPSPGPPLPGPNPSSNPGPGPQPSTFPGPAPTPTPAPSDTPTPTPTPTAPALTVTGLSVATGAPYEIRQTTDCCSNGMGRAWLDWPYVLQRNFGGGADNPLFMIRTAVADTNATADPMITFNINRCATVHVIFGEKFGGGAAPPYPSWLLAQGFACSVAPGGGGTVMTFYHETLGANDQVSGPRCFKSFPAGQVALGPRVPTGANSKMYTVFVDTLLASCAPFAPSNEKNQ